jgi:hypothetical protein
MSTEKLPTAEEFVVSKLHGWKSTAECDTHQFDNPFKAGEVKSMIIEFAKLHVQAALKAASENVHRIEQMSEEPYNGREPYSSQLSSIDRDSILTAYPLSKIE